MKKTEKTGCYNSSSIEETKRGGREEELVGGRGKEFLVVLHEQGGEGLSRPLKKGKGHLWKKGKTTGWSQEKSKHKRGGVLAIGTVCNQEKKGGGHTVVQAEKPEIKPTEPAKKPGEDGKHEKPTGRRSFPLGKQKRKYAKRRHLQTLLWGR